MVRYRRNLIAGGTFFFTVTLVDRASQALVVHVDALRAAMRQTRRSYPFAIDAVVVLPDHLHIVMTLPEGDADYPNRWRLIKRRFTDAVMKSGAPVAHHKMGSLRYGSVDIGNTPSGTTGISSDMSTIRISIQ